MKCMKIRWILLAILLLTLTAVCASALAGVPIDEAHFPDMNVRTSLKEDVDKDGDEILSEDEIQAVTELLWNGRCIDSLEGIGIFVNLEHLDCEENYLESLDLSGNVNLVDLCVTNNSGLTKLDVSKNTKLKRLWTLGTGITSLDISKCPDLVAVSRTSPGNLNGGYWYQDGELSLAVEKDVEVITGTETPSTPTPPPETSNPPEETTPPPATSNPPEVTPPPPDPTEEPETVIAIDSTNFPDENFRKIIKDEFDDDKDGSLSEAEISSANKLDCSNRQIRSMKGIQLLSQMMYLYCQENNLTELDVSGMEYLRQLYIYGNKILTLNVTGADILKSLVQARPRDAGETYDEFEYPMYTTILGMRRDTSMRLRVDPFVKVIAGEFISEPTQEPPVVPVTSITLNKTKATLTRTSDKKKPTLQLTATVLPDDATDPSAEWTSSNPKVAKVDGNGKVTALKKGTAVITCAAKDGSGVKATCKITVKDKLVTKLTLNKKKVTIKKGKTFQLKVTKLSPANAFNQKVTWKSSNTKIATVDKNGKVKAKKKGTCTITCTAADGSGKKVICKITVK